MSVIVKVASCVLAVPVIAFGVYVILHGHLTPGGGFPGGAVIATIVAMILIAGGGERAKSLNKELLSFLESAGLVIFALLGLLGIGTTFFYNFLANSGSFFGMKIPFGINPGYMWTGGVIPPMNMAVGLEVFAALSLIAVVMFTHEEDEND